MRNVAEYLKKEWKIKIDTPTGAYRHFQERVDQDSMAILNDFVIDVLGDGIATDNIRHAQVFAGYVVQEAVAAHINKGETDQASIMKAAQEKCDKYFLTHPWDQPKPNQIVLSEGEDFIPNRQHRAPRGSGMSKKDRSVALYTANKEKSRKELIEIFVAELGLTPPGASTYVHNCKSGLWK